MPAIPSNRGARCLCVSVVCICAGSAAPNLHGTENRSSSLNFSGFQLPASIFQLRVELRASRFVSDFRVQTSDLNRHLIASGFTGDPTAPVIGSGGATKKNS